MTRDPSAEDFCERLASDAEKASSDRPSTASEWSPGDGLSVQSIAEYLGRGGCTTFSAEALDDYRALRIRRPHPARGGSRAQVEQGGGGDGERTPAA